MAKHRAREMDLDDVPSQEPMRGIDPRATRRAPSADQKRVRRQMARSRAQEQQTMTNPKTAVGPHREAELLRMMAAASTLEDQRKIAAELESFRASKIEAQRRAASLELEPQLASTRQAQQAYHIRTSMASDWLMDVAAPSTTDGDRDRAMVAEASLWYTRRSQAVREDREEFTVQALGYSARLASAYPDEHQAAAQRTFLDHVGHLVGYEVTADLGIVPVNDSQTAPPVTTEPMDDINAPADTGPAKVDQSTPSSNPSLGEGSSPEGDHASEVAPVPQSASENVQDGAHQPSTHVDNTPFTTWQANLGRGAKRQALMDKVAVAWGRRHYEDLASVISNHPERDQLAKHFADHLMGTNPNYRRDQFQQAASSKGYQVRGGTGSANYSRGHYQHVANAIASYPGNKASVAKHFADHFAQGNPRFNRDTFLKATKSMSATSAAQEKAQYRYEVSMDHPSGTKHTEICTASGPEDAIAKIRGNFQEGSGTEHANWSAKRLTQATHRRVADAPTEDGLNSAVDFTPIADPIDSMSLGEGDEGEWPEAPAGVQAALYDVATDQPLGRATRHHELAAQASRSGTVWVDGDLMVIPAVIAREDYVRSPVRQAYVGIEKAAFDEEGNYDAPSTSDDFNDYGSNPMEGREPYEDPYSDAAAASEFPPPGVNPYQHAPEDFEDDGPVTIAPQASAKQRLVAVQLTVPHHKLRVGDTFEDGDVITEVHHDPEGTHINTQNGEDGYLKGKFRIERTNPGD